jgi:hypothetical protein
VKLVQVFRTQEDARMERKHPFAFISASLDGFAWHENGPWKNGTIKELSRIPPHASLAARPPCE